jgi:hypothetical protein
MNTFDEFIKNGQVILNDIDARNFVMELFWSDIPFMVQYDNCGNIIIIDIRDDGK